MTGVHIWTTGSQSPTLSALPALVSRPTRHHLRWPPVSTPYGVVACKTGGRCGVWAKKRGDARGKRRDKSPVGGEWRRVDYYRSCLRSPNQVAYWLTHGLDRIPTYRCLQCYSESFNRSTCTWKMINYTNRHNAGKQGQAFALPTQDTPSVTARPAMRLGFGCLMILSAPVSWSGRPLYSTSTNQTFFRRPYVLSN